MVLYGAICWCVDVYGGRWWFVYGIGGGLYDGVWWYMVYGGFGIMWWYIVVSCGMR